MDFCSELWRSTQIYQTHYKATVNKKWPLSNLASQKPYTENLKTKNDYNPIWLNNYTMKLNIDK